MPDEIKTKEIMEAVTVLRETVEQSQKDGLDKDKVEKINKFLDEQEDITQKAEVKAKADEERLAKDAETIEKLEKSAKEMGVSIETLELALAKGKGGGLNYKDGEDYKAFSEYSIKGFAGISEETKALLRTDRAVDGGVLVPVEMAADLLKEEIEISPMRAISRSRTMSSKTIEVPRRTTVPVALYEGEAEVGPDDASNYVLESLTAFRQTVTVPATMDILMDSAYDMESEINADVTLGFAQGSGNNFINGDGVKKPKGFLADTRLGNRDTAVTGVLDADTILLTTGDLKFGYNPVWTLNQRTLAIIRTLKGTDDHYLWQPGLNGVVANTLAGFDYFIMPDMPDVAAGAKVMGFGDFRRGYEIADRTDMMVIRDTVTVKRQAIIEWTFHRWNTGQVVLPEALRTLTIKA